MYRQEEMKLYLTSKITFGKYAKYDCRVTDLIESSDRKAIKWLMWLFAKTQYSASEDVQRALLRKWKELRPKQSIHERLYPVDYGDRRWEIGGPGSGEMSSWFD